MTTDEEQIQDLERRLADAERRGDVDALAELAVDDFTLVGPLGFVLDRTAWLDRYRSGDLRTPELSWEEVEIRQYGDAAIEIGRHTQRAFYRDQLVEGSYRGTHVLVRSGGGWRLAGIHLSPIATPGGSPR